MNLTDKEIIKCAEECVGDVPPCNTCPFDENSLATSECMGEVIKNLIGIINRLQDEKKALINGQETLQKTIVEQKAEIERLEEMLDSAVSSERNVVDNIGYEKSEAIKEFAERLEYFTLHEDPEINAIKCKDYESYMGGFNQFRLQMAKGIDNLAKELTERKE